MIITFENVSVTLLTPALRNLVKSTGKRPKVVELSLTTSPAHYVHNYRTQKAVSTVQPHKLEDTSYVGSDGENNPQTTTYYAAPVAEVRNPWRSGDAPEVAIHIGGFNEETLNALSDRFSRDQHHTARTLGLMGRGRLTAAEVALIADEAMSRETTPEAPAPAEATPSNPHVDMLASLGLD